MRLRLLFGAITTLLPAGLSAQAADFGAFRDSIAIISDVATLQSLERSNVLPGSARTLDPLVRRGLTALRMWEVTEDRADADRSRDLFATAIDRFPAEPWSHYGYALALAHGPEVRISVPGGLLNNITLAQSIAEVFGRDPRSRARRAIRRALELDRGLADAAVLLADLAVMDGGRRRNLIEEARDALRSVQAAGRADAGTARALAEMELALGNFAEAGAAAAGGEDAGVLRTQAIALLLQPGSAAAGAAAYWRGVELLDAAAAEQYYRDVAVLVTPAEEAEWRVADLEGRRIWLRRFWDVRAAGGGVTPVERLGEHYRRLTTARSRYLRNSARGTDGVGVLLDGEPKQDSPFDDRGIVLIRHGAPMSVVTTSQRGVLPNESWFYERIGEDPQLFHFVARRGAQNFSLARDLLQALDPAPGLDGPARVHAILTLIGDRAPYEKRYQAVLGRLTRLLRDQPNANVSGTEIRSMLELADAEYRPGARAALRTDSHFRTYTGDLPFLYDVFTFRTPEARTHLTAGFAIRADAVTPRPTGDGVEYALNLSVIVVDTLLDLVMRRDTTARLRFPAPLRADQMLRTNVTLPVQPSQDAVYRLVVADSVAGRGRMTTGTGQLRDYTDTGVMVSDVVLAHPDSIGDWTRGGETFALALPRTFERERPFTIYYEIYNLAPDRTFSTRITVEPVERGGVLGALRGLFGGGRRNVDVRFDDVAAPDADGVMPQTRELASDLGQGSYRMVVTVTTADGQTASTSSEFTVER